MRDLFQHIGSKKYNIACLQDVHIDKNLFTFIKSEWRYNVILSSKEGTNVNRGVMILINNNFACDLGRVLTDPNGNYVIYLILICYNRVENARQKDYIS